MKEELSIFKGPLVRSALAKKLLIKGENLRKFEVFRAKIELETLTYTEIENILLEKIISSAWKLERAMEIEKNILNQQNEIDGTKKDTGWHDTKKRRVRNIKKIRLFKEEVQHIIQYQIDTEKNMLKTLERLREEQKLRPVHKTDEK